MHANKKALSLREITQHLPMQASPGANTKEGLEPLPGIPAGVSRLLKTTRGRAGTEVIYKVRNKLMLGIERGAQQDADGVYMQITTLWQLSNFMAKNAHISASLLT